MNILEEMSNVSGCRGAMLVGRDGLVILQNMATGTDAKALGALAATMYRDIEKALSEAQLGKPGITIVEAAEGQVFLVDIGEGILVVVAESGVNTGMIRLRLRDGARQLKEVVARDVG